MPNYSYEVQLENKDYTLIKDTSNINGGISVTNAAEYVTEELYKYMGNKRIFYIDSCGIIDELSHKNGTFNGFKSGYPVELHEKFKRFVQDEELQKAINAAESVRPLEGKNIVKNTHRRKHKR